MTRPTAFPLYQPTRYNRGNRQRAPLKGNPLEVYLIILDSLGSIELLFIAIMALVFFGPRKLPQLSRTLGKNLAEFRKASEDFKRTWEREVALEEFKQDPDALLSYDDSVVGTSEEVRTSEEVTPEAPSEATQEAQPDTTTVETSSESVEILDTTNTTTQPEPLSKQNWL